MNKISEVANGYLQNKGKINEEFGKLNVKTLFRKKRTWNKNARIHKNDRQLLEK